MKAIELVCNLPHVRRRVDEGRNLPKPEAGEMIASVIVVNYNGGEQVLDCLHSLKTASGETAEIIVVDNASADGSAERIEAEFPAVKLLRSSENLGYGGGNNLGARHAHSKYLAFLNPDTVVDAGWLEALVEALEGDRDAGMATARVLLRERPDTVNTCGNDVHISGLTQCRGLGQPCQAYNKPCEVGAVSGAAFLMRRELFERLGGFDASFFLYMEDTDLSLRARLAGQHILYVPNAVVYHNYRMHFGLRKIYYLERNRYLMLLKVFRWRTLLALLPGLLLAEAVTWGFVLGCEPFRLGNKIEAYTAFLGNWSALMRARGDVQTTRKIPDRTLLEISIYQLDFEQIAKYRTACLAHYLFDPLFHICRNLTMKVVHW
jgi:GT2 family glycosyltransferase